MIRRLRLLVAAVVLAAALPALAAKRPLGPNERIDLNRASAAELMRLPGVGQKRAQAILAARAKSPFRKPDDVLTVKGLGPAWYARVKGWVTVGAAQGQPAAAPSRR
ncbi:MAG TPA: helix-hairpin-helix domain-containing protein [Anaeromyxobacteraceae bacterium]|nr:helix-hairpin-helix domain-containing protein [Anaeromyxobacteraceae bacterium]